MPVLQPPARWPAVLFLMLLPAWLAGCASAPSSAAEDTTEAGATTRAAAFTLAVQVDGDADGTLKALLARHLQLQRFAHLPDLQPGELRRLLGTAGGDAAQLLATQGYFSPAVTVDAGDGAHPTVTVQVRPGVRTEVAAVDIDVNGEAADAQLARRREQLQRQWPLAVGQPFTQAGWDDAKAQGLRRLQARRYPTARIADSSARIDADHARAQLAVTYDSGPAYRLGALQLQGLQRYDAEGLANLARLPAGQPYSETALLDAQQRLAASGYFDTVFLKLDTSHATATDAQGERSAPVVAQATEAPQNKLVLGVGLTTDSGPRLSLQHTHNRLPGLGWQARSTIELERNHQRAATDWLALPGEDGWRWFTGAQLLRETTGSYMVRSGQLRAGRQKDDGHISRSLYLQGDSASSQGVDAPEGSSSVSAHWGWSGQYFNRRTNPTRGWGLALDAGIGQTLHPSSEPFIRLLARWQGFVPLGRVDLGENVHRSSRLALRLEGGGVWVRKNASVPVTQLFVTGGDTSVRGYAWRSIGARTDSGTVYGGRYLRVASVEWQRPIELRGNRTDFESALFIDAGSVSNSATEVQNRVGLGAGLRWNSPVGPLQTDLAWSVHDRRLRLHLRLGYTF
ncbi:BamA/TamA family outer membrane protein [Comamonas faecalis]